MGRSRLWKHGGALLSTVLAGTLLVSCVPDEIDPRAAGRNGFKPRPIQQVDPVSGTPLSPEKPAGPSESDKNPWQKPKVTWPSAGAGEAELGAPAGAKSRSSAVDGRSHRLEHTPVEGLPVKVAPLAGKPREASGDAKKTAEEADTRKTAEKNAAKETHAENAAEKPTTEARSTKSATEPRTSESPEAPENTESPAPTASEQAEAPQDPEDPGASENAEEPETPEPSESRDATGGAPEKLHVEVTDRKHAAKLGIDGVLIGVSRSDGQNKPGRASIQLDYNDFKHAYGADWSSRLRLVELPACALTTPDKASCKGVKPLQTHNNSKTGVLTAQVDVAPDNTADNGTKSPQTREATVLAATAAPEGANGDFKATSLSPSGKWTAGGNEGGFSWSYDMQLPPVPGDLTPKLGLGYSSSSIDGRTASSNNQPSAIGEGWSMEMGFVERQYMSCKDDKGSGSNAPKKTGDMCWKSENAVMSLNGQSTQLVKDSKTGTWKPAHDDGSRIEHLKGTASDTANGDDDNEYWKVTEANGTQYLFGKHRLPGWSSGKAETNSTYTVPVYGNHAGEPGHGDSFANSVTTQAYRWNLDHVVDPHGNAMALFYDKETNAYSKNSAGTSTSTPKANATYTRGGYLSRVEYGHRAGKVFAANPAAKVVFGMSDRCLATGDGCKFDKAHADNWPDTPVDQQCTTGKECLNVSPTFWSRKRLSSVTSQVLKGGSYSDVDTWTLDHQFPGVGDAGGNGLWLESVTRTGKTAATTMTMPKVTFGGTLMPGRVDAAEGRPPLNKYRVTQVSSETGGDTLVQYTRPECSPASLPSPDGTNTKRCYPMWWTPDGGSEPDKDYFHKYLVTKVTEDDKVGGTESDVTEYEYLGGAAWAKDTSEFTLDKHRTHSDYRGYGTVRTRTGTENRTLEEARYFRGLDGATVTDSFGKTYTDAEPHHGAELETATYDKDGGKVSETVLNTPWSRQTASQSRPGTTDLKAYQVDTEKESHHTLLSDGKWRTTRTANTFDAFGQIVSENDEGDIAVSGDEACTRTTYVTPDKTNWLISFPATVQRTTASCSVPASEKNMLSEMRTSYDSRAHGTAPEYGKANATLAQELDRYQDGKQVFVENASAHDIHGRVVAETDANKQRTTTSYTPATGAQPTVMTVQDAKGHTTSTELDGLRGMTVKAVDASGRATLQEYNALGQLTAAWKPGRDKSKPADVLFDYQVRQDAPTAVTAKTLLENGAYRKAVTLYDGLLRQRQVQTDAYGGKGRVVKDTFYDSHGRAHKENAEYFNDDSRAAPTVLSVADHQIPSQTVTEFDGQGRTSASVVKSKNTEKWRTSTTYGGNWTAVVPPEGGTATLTFDNAHDKPLEVRQFKNRKPVPDASADQYEALKYTYDAADRLTELVDAAGNTWTSAYDLRGHAVRTTDPDKGTVKTTYTPDGKVATVSDARGQVLFHAYDEIGRPTAVRKDSATGEKLTEWTYDTLAGGKGKLSSSTRYENGKAYVNGVKGYDAAGRATGSVITVPETEGKLAGSYTFETAYTPHTGLAATTGYPAGGGLEAETVQHDYTEEGLATGLSSGDYVYALGTEYSVFGEVLQTILGDVGARSVRTFTYEEHTRRLSNAINDREADGPQTLDSKVYSYDPAGNVTKVRNDRDDKTVEDTQCYAYDWAQRLTNAWTGTDGCAARPESGGKPQVGGVDAYWHEYAYDTVGNRTTETQHDVSGDDTKDVKRGYTYPKPGETRPHSMDRVDIAGPGARTDSFEYDAAGNTTRRKTAHGDQKLTWSAEGHLASSTTGDKTSTFVYDADGNRLLRKDADKVTLYLDSQELTLDKASGEVSGVRYYKAQQATVVATSEGTLSYLLSDHHGTDEVAVDADSMEYTRREHGPFGTARGAQPGAGEWPGEKGFVGGTNDASTGLVHIGAREYDAENGRFVSVDPVMDLTDPQQMNAYAYANNTPVTASDPDGEFIRIVRPWKKVVKKVKKAVHKAKKAQRAKAAKAAKSYYAAKRAMWSHGGKGTQFGHFNIGKGKDRGIIMAKFFIHTKKAMKVPVLGYQLKGDSHGFSLNPGTAYRMVLFWNTKSGDVTFKVAPSHTLERKVTISSYATGGAPIPSKAASKMLPANKLKINGFPGDTIGGNNVVNHDYGGHHSTASKLDVGVHGVQSLFPLFAVDQSITIAANKSSVTVTRQGDAYPDMEVVQYRRNSAPRVAARDRMYKTDGLDSVPGIRSKVNRSWTNGKCTRGC